MKSNVNGWVSLDELNNDNSFVEAQQAEVNPVAMEAILEDEKLMDLSSNRRDFLKMLGFGISAATLASCEIPVKRAIPYVVAPDEIVPGVANYYASSFVNGGDYCSILVKTREGRPIKIEGNPSSKVTFGGTSARVQASVLSLYDINRLKNPAKINNGEATEMSWQDLDAEIIGKLNSNSKIRIIGSTQMSPTALKVVEEFCTKFPNARHLQYDPISSAALLQAVQNSFGQRALPDYRFDQAETIVSFNADFLGTWISPIEYSSQYAKRRTIQALDPKMSRHYQVESHMSMTGSNADSRILVKPSEQGVAIAYLYNLIASKAGQASQPESSGLTDRAKKGLNAAAESLWSNAGKSLVVSASNNVAEQTLVLAINSLLGNIGKTIGFSRVSYQRKGDERLMTECLKEINSSQVDALIFWNSNPCYDLPNGSEWASAISKVGLSISFNTIMDETTALCQYSAPDHHFLESWGDAEPKRGLLSLMQPAINPIFKTRQSPHSLLVWASSSNLLATAEQPYYEYLKSNWKNSYYSGPDFQTFWDSSLHNGVFERESGLPDTLAFNGNIAESLSGIGKPSSSPNEIVFYESIGVGNGQYANNPWLQELPDPVMRTTWGNYLGSTVSFDGDRRFLVENGVKEDGEILDLKIADSVYTLGSVKQFGLLSGTTSVALGYGRKQAGVCGTGVGTDFYPSLTTDANGFTQYFQSNVEIGKSSGKIEKHFACVQHHHTLGVTAIEKSSGQTFNADEAALVDDAFKGMTKGYQGSLTKRSIFRHSHVSEIKEKTEALLKERKAHQHLNEQTLYPGHDYLFNAGHQWGMHIDLNACIGCGSCAVACMAENNVPVVGKKEVSRHHEMTWLRIDRYYYGDVENPNVVYQPMMCQHCNNAPCENVCPVNATNHSAEGLNQMAYNRCVGTRYCANNCPYKVRRFNWYDFTTADLFPVNQKNLAGETERPYYAENLVRMVLNPDVTVRSRGVIEKCSFCVQRIQEGKLNAKKSQRKLLDSDVRTACQTACPTGAITFGDKNNPESQLSKKLDNPLNYLVLEEVNVASSVNYTMKVNNRDHSIDA
ncbi:MAG: TAT-variant-translocated molybdopterin oxidoreductase [Saprospiraceae bacterium]|nr:TAT-variant-translocated molybdopterin oxidoreductase [Saprospiraceae bacterium]